MEIHYVEINKFSSMANTVITSPAPLFIKNVAAAVVGLQSTLSQSNLFHFFR